MAELSKSEVNNKTVHAQLIVEAFDRGGGKTLSANIDEIISQAHMSLGREFRVVDLDDFAVILHRVLGAAVIMPGGDALKAEKASKTLGKLLFRNGWKTRVLPFAVSDTGVKPPVIIRSGEQMATDIKTVMERSGPVPDQVSDAKLIELELLLVGEKDKLTRKPRLDPILINFMEAAVSKVTGGRPILAGGVEIDPSEVVAPEFMLPALLISAAQNWSIPVKAAKGKGGFSVFMEKDSDAVLGYRVTGLVVSSPLLLLLPITNVMRRQKVNNEFLLDECVTRFASFMTINEMRPGYIEELEIRIAMSE